MTCLFLCFKFSQLDRGSAQNLSVQAVFGHFRVILQKKRDGQKTVSNGRGDKIRTCDSIVPNDVRYQTALHLERKQPRNTSRLCWLRNRDSNPNKQSQSLSCYRYTIPQNLLHLVCNVNNYSSKCLFCQ